MTYDDQNNMAIAMSETMNQINQEDAPVKIKSETLEDDISNLEKDIKNAEDSAALVESQAYSHTPVSPEQANEVKKEIVFMKKNLASKKLELKDLNI